ncbi:MAG: hypothetical protein R3E65_12090 [Steroidobacteraceae bacterium]
MNSIYYRHDDHLGNFQASDGTRQRFNVVMQSFGAYGQRRGTNWTGAPTPAELATINSTTRKRVHRARDAGLDRARALNGRVCSIP